MKSIKGEIIDAALNDSLRVYLCGNLTRAEKITHIPTSGLEIAISRYKEYTAEKPHYHQFNDEYNYVAVGEVKIYIVGKRKEYHFRQHDLFMIEPNETYVSKAKKGTEVFVVKSPGGNDKVLLNDVPDYVNQWLESWE